MSKETWDILQGAAILVPALVLIFFAGKVLYAFKSNQHARAWSPLIGMLENGVVTNDGGGASTSWLTGIYRQHSIQAAATPNRSGYHSSEGTRYNQFQLALQNVKGAQNWSVVFERSAFGMGTDGLEIRADDTGLEQRLRDADVLALAREAKCLTIRFDAQSSMLSLDRDITPLWTPTPMQFQQDLEWLLRLAHLNTQVNSQRPDSNDT